MRETMQAYSDMRVHHGTEAYKLVAEWLDSLICQNQISMTSCGKDKLSDAQVRIKQLMALRSAMVDPGGAYTGYTFD
jgi:hypothetical protein